MARALVTKGVTGIVLKYRLIETKGAGPHSVRLYADWTGARKPAELHFYSKGGHGFGMRKQDLPSDRWIDLFTDWLGVQGLLKK